VTEADPTEVEAAAEVEAASEVNDDADDADDDEAAAADTEPDDDADTGSTSLQARLENEGDIAADYLEELLDIADLDGDLDMDVEGERAVVSIVGAELQQLVGEHGAVLD